LARNANAAASVRLAFYSRWSQTAQRPSRLALRSFALAYIVPPTENREPAPSRPVFPEGNKVIKLDKPELAATTYTPLEDVVRTMSGRGATGRSIAAIAGAPGSGKSSVAAAMVETLNAKEPGSASLLGMDGFHFDDRVLIARGLLARKGAPHTFDTGGLLHMLRRLKSNDAEEIFVPEFDRAIEIARAAAKAIPKSVRHIVVEGNYLLLRRPFWSDLRAFFDTTIFLHVDRETLRRRLEHRWRALGKSEQGVQDWVSSNDLPNADLIIAESCPAEFTIQNE
jgi:pantothenate kinase